MDALPLVGSLLLVASALALLLIAVAGFARRSRKMEGTVPHDDKDRLARVERKVDMILRALGVVLKQEGRLMADLDQILADVTELPTINDSLDALLDALTAIIASSKPNQEKIDQIDAIVNTNKDRTKAAIVAHTPSAP